MVKKLRRRKGADSRVTRESPDTKLDYDDDDDVFKMARKDPIHAAQFCKGAISVMERGYHEELRRHIAEAYAIAYAFERDYKAWKVFQKDVFWKYRTKKPAFNNKLLQVLVWLFEAKDRLAYDRAWKYSVALEGYVSKGVKPEDVEEKIRHDGGIEALYRLASKARSAAKAHKDSLEQAALDDYLSDLDEPSDKVSHSRRNEAIMPDRKGGDTVTKREANSLHLSVGPKAAKKLASLHDGDKARLKIRWRGADSAVAARVLLVTRLSLK